MLITKKFDYRPLERVDSPNGRKYIVGETKPLPSVTTILGKTKDMTHLNEWVKRMGPVEAERIKTEAGTLGNGMHKNLEKYILGEDMSGNFMTRALAKVIIQKGLTHVNEIWGSEVALYSKELYAGTTDLVGLHNNVPSIMDFKNSIREKKKEWIEDYFIQLAAYAMAHNEMYDTDITKGVVMIATRDVTYQEFIIEGDEFRFYQGKWAEKLCAYYDKYGNE